MYEVLFEETTWTIYSTSSRSVTRYHVQWNRAYIFVERIVPVVPEREFGERTDRLFSPIFLQESRCLLFEAVACHSVPFFKYSNSLLVSKAHAQRLVQSNEEAERIMPSLPKRRQWAVSMFGGFFFPKQAVNCDYGTKWIYAVLRSKKKQSRWVIDAWKCRLAREEHCK